MKAFIDRDFLLTTDTAKHLYHDYAEPMPIIDYHCHLVPQEIYEDRKFENITQVWLGADHYKWRLMRSAGVDEKYVTGDATDREKFQKWAETIGLAIGNPLYHWSHLELRNYFGYEGALNGDTAEEVWNPAMLSCRNPVCPHATSSSIPMSRPCALPTTPPIPWNGIASWQKKASP